MVEPIERLPDRRNMLSHIGDVAHWDSVVSDWPHDGPTTFVRAYSDDVNRRLLHAWLPKHSASLLKTDLFDEAVGEGLYPVLQRASVTVVGIDISRATVDAAVARYPGLDARVGDVRALPFADGAFEVVVSNSTLDHFESFGDLVLGVTELARVVAPRGSLIITLDNPGNPLVALRNRLPAGLLRRVGLVPYYVGATCGSRRLREILREAGFVDVEISATMHFPRVGARLLGRAFSGRRRSAGLRALGSFEVLSKPPTRHLTGQFVAARAVRGAPPPGEREA